MKTDICTVVAALLMSDLDTRTKDGLFPCEKEPWLVHNGNLVVKKVWK